MSQKKRKGRREGAAEIPVLRFFGATETVTGSRFLVDTPHARVLVECGLFQGLKPLRERNWSAFPADPASIDAVVLSHAHLDHSGYLPALARNGFTGPVFCTPSTFELCRILLPDSGHLQEEEATYANRRGFSKHAPALPLYSEEDAQRSLGLFRPVPFAQTVDVAAGVRVTFQRAGHILGSAIVALEIDANRGHAASGHAASGRAVSGRTIVFSGDLGRPQHPVLRPPAPLPATDVLLVESTYGDRTHEDEANLQRFESALVRTAERGGVCVIPAFAVDRTEVILFHLRRLIAAGRVPNIPVYVDSPMALATLQLYRRALSSNDGGEEIEPHLRQDGSGSDPFDPGLLIEARRVEESMAINDEPGPAVIVSAAGMATGGRVLHHLARRLPDARNTVMLVGYQADGTRGRRLVDGAKSLKMLGRYIGVRAEIVNVPAFSVHADRDEILAWLKTAPKAPRTTFVVHGESKAAHALEERIQNDLGWTAAVPHYLEVVRLD